MRRGYQNDLIDDPQVSVVCDTLFFLMQGLTFVPSFEAKEDRPQSFQIYFAAGTEPFPLD
jgi:hypothetical protein